MRRPTLPATRGLCRAQLPLVFSAHPRNREPITTTPQSFPNHIPAARSRQTDDPTLDKHPRLNHRPCLIQERFLHNHYSTSTQRRGRRRNWGKSRCEKQRSAKDFTRSPEVPDDARQQSLIPLTPRRRCSLQYDLQNRITRAAHSRHISPFSSEDQ